MISEELKNLISRLGSLVIVENNQPKFVVLSYDKFNGVIHKSIDNSGDFAQDSNEELTDRLNKEILVLKEQVAEKEKDLLNNL